MSRFKARSCVASYSHALLCPMSFPRVSFINIASLPSLTLSLAFIPVIGFLSSLLYFVVLQSHNALPHRSTMISQKIFDLCHSSNTISSKIAENPHLAPSHAAHTLYRRHGGTAHHTGSANGAAKDGYDLERAYNCGQWGSTTPSNLFLKARCSFGCTPTEHILIQEVADIQ